MWAAPHVLAQLMSLHQAQAAEQPDRFPSVAGLVLLTDTSHVMLSHAVAEWVEFMKGSAGIQRVVSLLTDSEVKTYAGQGWGGGEVGGRGR